MLKQPWVVDVLVWAAMSFVFVVASFALIEATRPPTPAEYRAQQERKVSQQCLASADVKAMPGQMQQSYCGCIVSEVWTFGGINDERAQVCLVRASSVMRTAKELPEKFAAAYPAICERFAGISADAGPRGSKSFCGCMADSVGKDTRRMAAYAFAGMDSDKTAQGKDVNSCKSALEFGKKWIAEVVDKNPTTSLTIKLPGLYDGRLPEKIEFRCEAGIPALRLFDHFDKLYDQDVVFLNEMDDTLGRQPGGQVTRAKDVMRFYRELQTTASAYDKDAISSSGIRMVTEQSSVQISLVDFNAAASGFDAACKETLPDLPQAPAAPTTSAVDEWFEMGPTSVGLKDGALDWYGVMSCDEEYPPFYVEISGALVEAAVKQRYPGDLDGSFRADDMPVDVVIDGETAFSGKEVCAWGMDTQGLACFVQLNKERLEALAAGSTVSWKVAGQSTQAAAFGASPLVRKLLPYCLKYSK